MRIFVTGASGWIGSAVVRELLNAGHEVVGLARSDKSAASLTKAGAMVQRGTIDNLDSLRSGAAAADGAIHLAFFHKFSHASISTRLRILLGGSPRHAPSRFIAAAQAVDQRAIETLATTLKGPDRPLVVAFPTMALTPGRLATEEDAADPNSVGGVRVRSEKAALAMVSHGVRASIVRIPPSVHGPGDKGLVAQLIDIARKKGVSAYVADGTNRWPAVHRLDAAHLFCLAMEKAPAGTVLHAAAEEGVPFCDIASAIGRHLNLPVVSISPEEATSHFGWLGPFVSNDNPVSSELTRKRLGWKPEHVDLLADIEQGHYFQDRT